MNKNTRKRVMVDMSATIIHQGHTRLLERASEYGSEIVGLTTDEEVLRRKGYQPEIPFESRKEILHAIKGVEEVVPTPWLITEEVLDDHQIDLLIHGDDNANHISAEGLLLLPRTKGVSSTEIRLNTLRSITQINNQKLMLTPGSAAFLHENLQYLKPIFGRGDDEYLNMEEQVLQWIKKPSGQDEIVLAQGSATFAIEMAARGFVSGKVLLLSTGFYSDRIRNLLPASCQTTVCCFDELDDIAGICDWVICVYTETGEATKPDLVKVRESANRLGASLFVDATGSIGLEEGHNLADVAAFSSCKGLFGLADAAFIAYKKDLEFFNIHNDQQETNIHNTSVWLDRVPKALLSFLIFAGGIVTPLYLRRIKNGYDRMRRGWWLLPTIVCLPTAAFATMTTWPAKIEHKTDLSFYSYQAQEMKELYVAYFLLLFIVSLGLRLRRMVQHGEPFPPPECHAPHLI